jgi:hypothetical protein
MDSARCLAVRGAPLRLAVVADAERFELGEVVVERISVLVVKLEVGLAVGEAAADASVAVWVLLGLARLSRWRFLEL